MRINLAKDPSLRSGTTNSFRALPGTNISLSEEWAFYGKYSLLVTKDAVNGAGVEIAEPVPVIAGKNYSFSIYSSLPTEIPRAEGAEIVMQIEWMNSLGTVISTVSSATLVMDSDETDYRLGGVWIAPTGATFVSVSIIQPLTGSQGATFFLDALLIEQSNYIGGYFDNIPQANKNQIVNKALSAVPQVINGIRLGADVVLNGLVLNTIDEDDTVWVVTDIEGWWGQADPEIPDIARGTEDGSYDVEGRTKARSLTLSGFFIPKDAEQSLSKSIDRLILATSLTRKGGWLHAHEEPTKAAWVRLSSKPNIKTVNARGRTNFTISLRAGDPIKYHWNDADPDGFSGADYRSSDIIDEQYINLATHGTFELPGAATEVRKNWNTNPRLISNTTGWATTVSNATLAGTALGAYVELTANPPGGPLFFNAANIASAAGDYWASSFEVEVPAGNPAVTLDLRVHSYGQEAAISTSGAVTVQPGTTVTITAKANIPTTAATTGVRSILYGQAPTAIGAKFFVRKALLEKQALVGPYFDGSTVLGDPDVTASWVSGVDTSESVINGSNVAQYATSISVARAVKSTQWKKDGSSSLRIIPVYSSRGSAFTTLASHASTQGMQFGKTYTVLIWFYQNQVQPTDNPLSRSMTLTKKALADSGYTNISVKAPNVIGESLIRAQVTLPPDGEWYLRMYNGGMVGDPDIWVDGLTIVEGEYSGPPFSGNTPSDPGEVYSWSGGVNASTSLRTVYNEDILTNIGTADVTGTFTITGPAGAGTRIYNATTEQLMELAQPLRGAGLIADAYEVSSTGGIATIKTKAPNHLRVGDEVSLLNMVIPFSESDQTRIVTAVSDIFPYSFSVAIPTDDIDPMGTTGQIRLVNNDVLSIDTYNRAVTYNGEISGHRDKLTTLTDWIKFAPGDNVIEFFDDVTETEVISKALSGNVVTLETADTHYLVPGEKFKVALPESKPLSKKSLAGNVVTLTTAVPHGYSVGDSVDVQSTETAKVITKSRAANVATLTTETPHGVAVSDTIVVALPVAASPNQKELTSNVAKLSFQNAHGFSVGDSVTVALPTQAAITNKQLTSNQAILTTATGHTFAVGDQITVAMPGGATVVSKTRNGSQAILTTSGSHGFSVGDSIEVGFSTSATLTGVRTADATTYLRTFNTTAAHGFSAGDRVTIELTNQLSFQVMQRAATTTTITLTTNLAHGFAPGEVIQTSGALPARYQGTFKIASVTATTITATSSGAAEPQTAANGTVGNVTLSGNGSLFFNVVIEDIPSLTSFRIREWENALDINGGVTSGTVTNHTNATYNGTKTVISASGTTFAYNI